MNIFNMLITNTTVTKIMICRWHWFELAPPVIFRPLDCLCVFKTPNCKYAWLDQIIYIALSLNTPGDTFILLYGHLKLSVTLFCKLYNSSPGRCVSHLGKYWQAANNNLPLLIVSKINWFIHSSLRFDLTKQ